MKLFRTRHRTCKKIQSDPRAARPKLLFITAIGTTQVSFLRGQNRYIAAHGFELHSIASPGPTLEELRTRDGVETHPVVISRRIAPFADLASLFGIYRVLRRVQPTIVHVSTPKAALLGALAATAARVPVRIFLVRGLATENAAGLMRRMYRWAEWTTANLCHRTLFVSRSLREFAHSQRIIRKNRDDVLANGMSNGIDVERFDPSQTSAIPLLCGGPQQAPVIGFVGRLAHDKGIEELAEAWILLRDEFPGLKLALVGEWEIESPISSTLRSLLEQDARVVITGYVSDVERYYKSMSLFVFPSHGTEGFPNAPMEAAAMELPVIATKVVGCVDAVHDGVTGTLIPARDPTALAAAIRQYLNDPDVRRKHGTAGRLRVATLFRPDLIWRSVLHEYLTLMQEQGFPLPQLPQNRAEKRTSQVA